MGCPFFLAAQTGIALHTFGRVPPMIATAQLVSLRIVIAPTWHGICAKPGCGAGEATLGTRAFMAAFNEAGWHCFAVPGKQVVERGFQLAPQILGL